MTVGLNYWCHKVWLAVKTIDIMTWLIWLSAWTTGVTRCDWLSRLVISGHDLYDCLSGLLVSQGVIGCQHYRYHDMTYMTVGRNYWCHWLSRLVISRHDLYDCLSRLLVPQGVIGCQHFWYHDMTYMTVSLNYWCHKVWLAVKTSDIMTWLIWMSVRTTGATRCDWLATLLISWHDIYDCLPELLVSQCVTDYLSQGLIGLVTSWHDSYDWLSRLLLTKCVADSHQHY